VYENSVFAAARPGALLIDCSTIDPATTRHLNVLATQKHKLRFIDAPVSGGVGGAEAGTLTFMVGGPKADFDAARGTLEMMGKNVVHVGDAGTGQIAKICNNLVLGISMNAVSEAMNLGVKLGADPRTLAAIINTSSGRCWSSELYNPVPGVLPNVPASRGYTGGFGAALMTKDLGLALDAAKSVGAPLPTGSAAFATYQIMLNQGMGTKDFSSVYAFLQGQRLDK
jgi:3-hydroxyisobutyrate dehydrogenase